MTVAFPNHTPTEVAAIYHGLIAKGFPKLASHLAMYYEDAAPTADHFNEFNRIVFEIDEHRELTAPELAMVDAAWERHKSAGATQKR